jgi:hypothetical protein
MRWLSLLALLAGLQAARAIDLFGRTRDPFGHFCGKADCYEVLGVAREAEKEEIRKAYRGLSREHHPDKGGDKVKFAVIAKAYEVLNNDEKREEYNFIVSGDIGLGVLAKAWILTCPRLQQTAGPP